MDTRNNKLYGIYSTEMELQEEMDRLRTQGYTEEDMYIVSNRNEQLSMYRGSATYENGTKEESWWDRFKAFIMGEDAVRDKYFTHMDIPEKDRNRYYQELQEGKFLLYVDKNYGTYFDEGTKNYGVGQDYQPLNEPHLTPHDKAEAQDHQRTSNLDEALHRSQRPF